MWHQKESEEDPLQTGAVNIQTETGDDEIISKDAKYKLKKFWVLTVAFVTHFLLIFLDWFLDVITSYTYFKKDLVPFGILCLLFVLLSGVICTIRLPFIRRKYKGFNSRFLYYASFIPTLQPTVYGFEYFRALIKSYPETTTPKLLTLEEICNHLNVLEGVFEAAPQAVLQIYALFIDYSRNDRSLDLNLGLAFTGLKILLSLISMSRVAIKYIKEQSPYVFPLDKQPTQDEESEPIGSIHAKFRTFGDSVAQLPLFLEFLFLCCLRSTTIVTALHLLHEAIEPGYFGTLSLVIVILELALILMIPRFLYAIVMWSRCILCNSTLPREWKESGASEQRKYVQRREYFLKFLSRSCISIFVYPLHPSPQWFLWCVMNLELIVTFAICTAVRTKHTEMCYLLLGLGIAYYTSFIARFIHERLALRSNKNRFYNSHRLAVHCQLLLNFSYTNFKDLHNLVSDFSRLYAKVNPRCFLRDEGLVEGASQHELSPSDLGKLKSYQNRIAEGGKWLVIKDLPVHLLVNHVCQHLITKIRFKYTENGNVLLSREHADFSPSPEGVVSVLLGILSRNRTYNPAECYNPYLGFKNFELPLSLFKSDE